MHFSYTRWTSQENSSYPIPKTAMSTKSVHLHLCSYKSCSHNSQKHAQNQLCSCTDSNVKTFTDSGSCCWIKRVLSRSSGYFSTKTMSQFMYASSASWYCANAFDADEHGRLYFVGNSSLFILDTACHPPKYLLKSVHFCCLCCVGYQTKF